MIARGCEEVFNNYRFAKEFGWTPQQVEEVDSATQWELSVVIDEIAREEERRMKQASRK